MIRRVCGIIACISEFISCLSVFSLVAIKGWREGWLVDGGRLARLKLVSAELTLVWFRRC